MSKYPLETRETYQELLDLGLSPENRHHRVYPIGGGLIAELAILSNSPTNPATDPAILRGLPTLDIYAIVIRREDTGAHFSTLVHDRLPRAVD